MDLSLKLRSLSFLSKKHSVRRALPLSAVAFLCASSVRCRSPVLSSLFRSRSSGRKDARSEKSKQSDFVSLFFSVVDARIVLAKKKTFFSPFARPEPAQCLRERSLSSERVEYFEDSAPVGFKEPIEPL